MHRARPLLTAFALLLWTTRALAAAEEPWSLAERVREHRLANRLTVLVLERPESPTVSLQMTFKVGGTDESAGQTGTAHLLEHLLFKGTRDLGTRDWAQEEPLLAQIEAAGRALDAARRKGREEAVQALAERLADLQRRHRPLVVKDEIDALYTRNGAVGFNAFTTADLTSYIVSLPANRLELWARIESERVRDPVLREFYVERDVVVEERRQRYGADPGGLVYEALLSTAFAAHPYRDPVIGWPSDLANLDPEPTRRFYRRYYGPENLVVVAVGAVEPAAFFALMERYFGALPARAQTAPWATPAATTEPPQRGPKRVEVHFDAQPQLIVAYHKPTLPHRDDYVFDAIDALLSDGRSSRLVRELVDRQRLAASVSTVNGIPGARYANLFAVFCTPLAGVEPAAIEVAVDRELERLASEPPGPAELQRVLRRLQAARIRSLDSNRGLARNLAYFQTVAGDWRYLVEHAEVLAGITADEVAAAVRTYLVPTNRTTAVLVPTGNAAGDT